MERRNYKIMPDEAAKSARAADDRESSLAKGSYAVRHAAVIVYNGFLQRLSSHFLLPESYFRLHGTEPVSLLFFAAKRK